MGLDELKFNVVGIEFYCTLEESWSDHSTANASWNYGTDKKIGGTPKSGIFINIRMNAKQDWFVKKVNSMIRGVRPFKRSLVPSTYDISGFWQNGFDDNILEDLRKYLKREIPKLGVTTPQYVSLSEEEKKQLEENELEEIKKQKAAVKSQQRKDAAKRKAEREEYYRNREKAEASTKSAAQKARLRKYLKLIIPIACTLIGLLVVVTVLGNGEISLPDMPVLLPDLLESIPNITQSCEVYDSIRITSGTSQGKISLMSCSIENKDVLTVSGDLSKSAQINLTLLNPDMKKIQDVTFVKKEFSHIIGEELYSKDDGKWRINVIVGGKLQGVLKFIAN